MNRKLLAVLCAVLVFAAAGPVSAEILDFVGLGASYPNETPIPDGYGDLKIGDDTKLHLTYRSVDAFGENSADYGDLNWTAPQSNVYGDLPGVAYGDMLGSVGEIRFQGMTVGGQQYGVQLTSFDMAAFDAGEYEGATIKVYNEKWEEVASWNDQTIIGGTSHSTLLFNPVVSSSTLILQWSDAYWTGINYIVYDAVAVPEPATVIGWVIGLGCLGYVTYRRRGR